jgi:hypothetical protein
VIWPEKNNNNTDGVLYLELKLLTFMMTSKANAITTDTMKIHPTASLQQFLIASPLQVAI